MPKADLHIHTVHSDGLLTPKQVVNEAVSKNLAAIAITDHDAIEGFKPANDAAAGHNIEVVPGVELSSYIGDDGVHVVGLYIDVENERLMEHLAFFRDQRYLRGEKIVNKLNELGVPLKMEDVLQVSGTASVGRPHIADAIVKLGAVATFDDAFKYFIGNHKPAYVPKFKISPSQAAEIIHDSGGVAILAHPGITLENDRRITEIMAMGMDGIEIAHPKHQPTQESHFRDLALKNRWLMSGGSDCHGNRRNTPSVGDCWVDSENLSRIREFRNSRFRQVSQITGN